MDVCGVFQSTFELVHVLNECTIVQAVVLYLECVESLSEQHIETQYHNVKRPKRVCIFNTTLKGCVNSGSNTTPEGMCKLGSNTTPEGMCKLREQHYPRRDV